MSAVARALLRCLFFGLVRDGQRLLLDGDIGAQHRGRPPQLDNPVVDKHSAG
jgi:hypothetical protein